MSTNIGTAKLSITVDTTDYELGIERAKQRLSGMTGAAQQEYEKLTRVEKRRVDSLQMQTDKLGLSRQAQLAYDATLKTSGKVQEELLSRINKTTAAVKTSGIQFNEYGLSAKQTTAALRQVPAQLTDIFVGLQGGQNPLTVLIQQGGQLKDVFGGVVPAAKALGGSLLALINPYTVLAAVIATVGVGFLKGAQETSDFNKAIIQSGNYADTSAGQLAGLAAQIDNLSGSSTASATKALTAVVSAGVFSQDQLALVATAAEQLRASTGRDIKETVAEFAELGKSPVDAILKLNSSQNFLTQGTYDQIVALQKQGDEVGAAQVAMEAYAAAINDRTPAILENLGLIEKAFKYIKIGAVEALDALYSVGRAKTIADITDQQRQAEDSLARERAANARTNGGNLRNVIEAENRLLGLMEQKKQLVVETESQRKALGTDDAATTKELQAKTRLEQTRVSLLSKELQLEEQIAKIHADAKAAGGGEKELALAKELEASARRRFAEQNKAKGGAGAARSLANAGADIQAIKDALGIEQAELKNSTRVLQAEYRARLITTKVYYEQNRALVVAGAAAEEKAILAQIATLQARNVTGKDSINVSKEIGKLEAQLVKLRGEHAAALKVLGIEETAVNAARQEAIAAYREALQDTNAAQRESNAAALLGITTGEQEAELQGKLAKVYSQAADERKKLAREFADNNDKEVYDAKLADLEIFVLAQTNLVRDGYEDMKAAQGDWLNGVTTGIANWMAETANVAKQVDKIVTNTLDSTADALATFATTGALDIKQFLADILKEIANFMAKQAVLEFLKAFTGKDGDSNDIGSIVQSIVSIFTKNAKGNVYSSDSLSRYSGSVVDRPTPFAFAKGAGIMGEAGPEGIFPLKRGSDGKLGVTVSGGMGNNVTLNVITNVASDGTTTSETRGDRQNAYAQFADEMRAMADERIRRSLMQGGSLWKAGVAAR